jgi:hypothetical protein
MIPASTRASQPGNGAAFADPPKASGLYYSQVIASNGAVLSSN